MHLKLLQYCHTAKYLKGRQIAGQVWNRVRSRFENPSRFSSQQKIPDISAPRWTSDVLLPEPGGHGALQDSVREGIFTFLNRKEDLGWPPRWHVPELPRLWQYNLHYFDWLWKLEEAAARQVVEHWIAHHPPGKVGWEPYPTSLRLMNWTGYFFGNGNCVKSNDKFTALLWKSIYLQAEWLRQRLEYHLMANHLLENAAALALVGSCFSGPEARVWYEAGFNLVQKEIEEQILPDGMHFERSPMYHCRILYLLLLLAATRDKELEDLVNEPIKRMADALLKITHPDGRIALLNDSAFRIYHEPEELLKEVERLSPGLSYSTGAFALKKAGYYGWRGIEGNYLICNAGAVGPDYQPGHAHADIFSFEVSLRGKRLIVDSGVCSYETGKDREYCRSTRAHNTVEVAGKDQSEMWGSFRVAERAAVKVLDWRPSNQGFTLEAVHDGYTRVKAGLSHSRRFNWKAEGILEVADTLSGKAPEAVSRLHLHPDCTIEVREGNRAFVCREAVKAEISFEGRGRLKIEDSMYCPEFGKKVANKELAFYLEDGSSSAGFNIRLC